MQYGVSCMLLRCSFFQERLWNCEPALAINNMTIMLILYMCRILVCELVLESNWEKENWCTTLTSKEFLYCDISKVHNGTVFWHSTVVCYSYRFSGMWLFNWCYFHEHPRISFKKEAAIYYLQILFLSMWTFVIVWPFLVLIFHHVPFISYHLWKYIS